MAKVRVIYALTRTFDESMVQPVHRVYGTKGIKAVDAMGMHTINVDYDDGVLSAADVDRIMIGAGLPVSRTSTPTQGSGSEPGETKKAGNCFIATAACGNPFAPEVRILSAFRDDVLVRSRIGAAFVRLYYTLSPPVAAVIARSASFQRVAMAMLVKPAARVVASLRLRDAGGQSRGRQC